MCKVVGTKPKVQWRLHEATEATNVEYLLRKDAAQEYSQPEKGCMACNSKVIGVGLATPSGIHILPLCVLNIR